MTIHLVAPPFKLSKLHPDIATVSFRHRRELSAKFRDVLGLYYLDHISIEIVCPQGELLALSSTPAQVYNLVMSKLWRYDGAWSPDFYRRKEFYFWSEAYCPASADILQKVKQSEHGFSCGFVLVRKINNYFLLYSFASKVADPDLKQFYQSEIANLRKVGDYCYKLIRPIYLPYNQQQEAPIIGQASQKPMPYLQLVVDNTRI